MYGHVAKLFQPGSRWVVVVMMMMAGGSSQASGIVIPGLLADGRIQVESAQALKFRNIVPQGTDYSCGSASVATILKYAYGMNISGPAVLRGMLMTSNQAEVKKHGFSMLDMQRYVDRLGYQGVGFHVPLRSLLDLKMPVIVLLNLHGYEHFVVLKRLDHGYVDLADPRLGNREISVKAFSKDWNSVIFAIVGRDYKPSTPLRRVGGRTRVHGMIPLVRQVLSAPTGHFGATPINEF